ncbi:MAG: hypothetical protein LUC20_07990, partial [Oscillospiraceae bacterium]|nr:hypothetical protein [Oscillospiraceae bacterium]
MKTRLISLLMSALLLFTLVPVGAFADDEAGGTSTSTAIVTVESGTVAAGDSITLNVAMANVQDFTNFEFGIKYDTDVFTRFAFGTTYNATIAGTEYTYPANCLTNATPTYNDSNATIAVANSSVITLGDDGILFTITLTADADAYNGDYEISLIGAQSDEPLLNNSGVAVDVKYVSGTVTITGGQDFTAEAPSIITQPTGATYTYGDTDAAVLSVAAEAADGGTLSYQWY